MRNGILNFLAGLYLRFRHYRIVAYNNRMYEGYKFVNGDEYTIIGAKMWINEFADRTRYLYDLYDTKKRALVYDFSEMFRDFDSVKNIIRTTNGTQQDSVRKMIFNFKAKWTPVVGDQAASIYFADLMTIYNERYKDYQNCE